MPDTPQQNTSPPKVMSGARAIVFVNGTPVGIFNNFAYGMMYDVQPAFILGRYSAAEIEYTAQEPVQCSGSGWRSIGEGKGPHTAMSVPRLQDLLHQGYIRLAVYDRQTKEFMCDIVQVRTTGYQTALTARQLEEITVSFVGLRASTPDDPHGAESHEGPEATELP